MNFDVVIIGGGLAGLTCGIALQKQGKQCAIINNGQAAIDFSSGSMDLLSCLPSGQKVHVFCEAFAELSQQAPEHPYCLLGQHQVVAKVQQFEQLMQELGLVGSHKQHHLRVTPLGGLRHTWLSPKSVPVIAENEHFPYRQIAILGIEGYHDFQPQILVDNLKQNAAFSHCDFSIGYLNIPELDYLRQNAREFRSVNIAQLLEHKLAFEDLVQEIKQAAGNAQAVFLPACFGLDDQGFFDSLKQATALVLFELPTLPPSLIGIRQHRTLRDQFEKLGGLLLNGDRTVSAEFGGDRVARIFTTLHQEESINADHFVLASGSFFSNGLVAEFERVKEPIFDLDIIGNKAFINSERASWTDKRFAAAQPYQSAGVAINHHCQVYKNGNLIPNLYAIGNVLGGFLGIEQGCASGVSIVTALTVAERVGGTK
ncbi:glycerol-3-phosphate dehydrogenase subunit GlpB [[Haemophilus] ducreyi]|uniref:glycerol-3-phosphate dehydrogenase subunit GlpB n=1 Tax=Haemophilus ducreyi TaxID=730 RepID=UPI000655DFA9|nr:glycerol-3-phosphate dehydrogenase subunit GlpB [[Haemophilus] ducreyi]AKO45443.1 glycerol-3-phosphate dehydrogenase [[Haemophilus] ducreyi]AKO46830.1 glycerol-3-phosphate dehydrogenase [[Haemophilus] ducreyi]AKO48169.1 glycerol-3-phosphate dehydrogenase [[Haemophilus] ducreyi]AKO49560.1 glycerol-3-phosphate dehydrogenase [[Haemophilus] ducreyi]ANF62472.1 anaerobic glycerol-3-phosphate dehydrogenase subunit B [[Haemophilus] ducreyi]